MSSSTARKLIAPVYAVLIVVGFVVNAAVGVTVAVLGGMVMGIGWSALRGRQHFDSTTTGPSHDDGRAAS